MSDDFARASARAAPAVGRPPSRWVLPAGIAGVVLLGVATFAAVYEPGAKPQEALAVSTRAPTTSADLPPPPTLAPAPIAAAPVIAAPVAAPLPPLPAPPPPAAVPPVIRPVTPAVVVDLSVPERPGDRPEAATAAATGSEGRTNPRVASNQAFLDRVTRDRVDTVGTDRLSSTDLVIPQGTIITGVLETAINSDLPGLVRAVVSRDVRGFDGSKILIPRGSRLIGQYSNGVALGQSRAFVIWTRVLRSDGVSVQLGSAATDALGSAGLTGKVNSHFLRRFGSAALLSVITGGIDYLVATANNGGVTIGSPQQATQLAGIALQREIDIPPTIKVAQGTPVRVFVAKDLDFAVERAAR
ncbi:type IV secretion system protein VirB10 [Glacieibacterium frigidum]|uniref:TrbI/VirB10 family protein n=1 Tax=Glacieibacterium frigidum TaxID=2593303 RepID=A0A552UH00_9SPHN|nr:type IV secretion system protein VirB10 [Glacieibacterium frigidum]TRW17513.1 TrbI/VirB10 family protein [Glacieibacterium frigidum]